MGTIKLAAIAAAAVLTIAACGDGNDAVATPVTESPVVATPAAEASTPASGSAPGDTEATEGPVVTAEPAASDGGG